MNKIELYKKLIKDSSLPVFAVLSSRNKWFIKPHLLLICLKIYELLNSDKDILVVNMPPRHGKSELLSKYFPAWYLLNNPSKRVILTTYSDTFASMFGRTAQDLYIMFMRYYNIGIYQRKQTAGEWLTDCGGGMVSVGSGGSLTGRGADLLIIDDPIKNVSEAISKINKENLNDWFKSTALTRLEPGGKVILIMTRWQHDDITGDLLEHTDPNRLIHLKLKAVSDENEFFRTKDSALWRERYSLDELSKIKDLISPYWFNAMYQQEPGIKGGEIININNFNFYVEDGVNLICVEKNLTINKRDTVKYCTVDLAISQKDSADFTVAMIFRIDLWNNIFIERIIRKHLPPDQHEEELEKIYRDFNISIMGVESVAYQETLIQRLLSRGLSVLKLLPHKDKLVRVLSMIPILSEGKIYIKSGQTWEKEFLSELSLFPHGKHDDQCDCFAYIANFVGMGKRSDITSVKLTRHSSDISNYF